jgi:MYXO-CTERM domain-containing protein
MKNRLVVLALLLLSGPAQAVAPLPSVAPSPEMDLGLAAFAMLAGAAVLARRRRL